MSRYFSRLLLLALLLGTGGALADSREQIDRAAAALLAQLRQDSGQAAGLLDQAHAVLVFPDLFRLGFGIGGHYGEGTLLTDGEDPRYYATAGGPLDDSGPNAQVILFMNRAELEAFTRERSWQRSRAPALRGISLGAAGIQFDTPMAGNKITLITR